MFISSSVIPAQAGIHFEFLSPLDSMVRRKNGDSRWNDEAWIVCC